MDEALHEWRVYYGISDTAFHELRCILFGGEVPSIPPQDILTMEEVPTDTFISGQWASSTIEPTNDSSIQASDLNLFAYDMRGCTELVALADSMNEPLLGNSFSMESLSSGFRSSQDAWVPPTSSCDPSLFAPGLSAEPPQRKRKTMARKREHGVEKPVKPCASCWFSKRLVCDGHFVYTVQIIAYGL